MTHKPIQLDELLAYAAGDLDAAAVRDMDVRLAADSDAQSTLARIRSLQQIACTDDSVAPPADVMARARALFAERRQPQTVSLLESVRRVVAELLFDSRLTPALQGVRGATKGYQVAYQSELAELEFEIAPFAVSPGSQRTLIGQVTPTGEAAVQAIELRSAEGEIHAATPDVGGAFTLHIATGFYRITCRCGESEVVIDDVRID